ncbi:hypothetical protein TspCOW1_03880 [Thiohalobacter sp. COW1]|uniref:Hydrogenase maturation protease n=1 Tax=Thiohalobacter thiocyanaticus TaxID=585455 RepID=A0A1Z4VSN3_9GAMM|nr:MULTISPECIES: hypothetical protein [Thiohalobacter]BAZ94647.1 hydrogenase maturation protease [Thiohalobacter thiocyanaticus]BCO30285.1 hypothetical protein TspCOW1_03880 [Thiohalobacter sp. COW1]
MAHLQEQAGVFGVGSAQGVDALGWAAIDYLRTALSGHPAVESVRWHVCRTPADMLPHWDALDRVILLDAMPVTGPDAGPRWVTLQALEAAGGLSSHGLGIREVVELAAALELRPRLSILGLVVDPQAGQTPADWLAQQGPALTRMVAARLQGMESDEAL